MKSAIHLSKWKLRVPQEPEQRLAAPNKQMS
jgi:hypothetical protein